MEERPLAVADVVERLAESEMEIGPLAAGEGVRRGQQRPHGRQMRSSGVVRLALTRWR